MRVNERDDRRKRLTKDAARRKSEQRMKRMSSKRKSVDAESELAFRANVVQSKSILSDAVQYVSRTFRFGSSESSGAVEPVMCSLPEEGAKPVLALPEREEGKALDEFTRQMGGLNSPFLGIEYDEQFTESLLFGSGDVMDGIKEFIKDGEMSIILDFMSENTTQYIHTCPMLFNFPSYTATLMEGPDGKLTITSALVRSGILKDIPQYAIQITARDHAFLVLVGWRLDDRGDPADSRTGFIFEGHMGNVVSDEVSALIRRDLGLRHMVQTTDLVTRAVLQGGYGVCASLAFGFHMLADKNPNASVTSMLLQIPKMGMQLVAHTSYMVYLKGSELEDYFTYTYTTQRALLEIQEGILLRDGEVKKFTWHEDFYNMDEADWLRLQLPNFTTRGLSILPTLGIINLISFTTVLYEMLDEKIADKILAGIDHDRTSIIYKELHESMFMLATDPHYDRTPDSVDKDMTPSACSALLRDNCRANKRCKRCGFQCIDREEERCSGNVAYLANETSFVKR